MPQSHVDALSDDPDLAEGFFGAEPELEEPEALLLAFYLDARSATSRDAPVDRRAALELYERVHGEIDPRWFLRALAAMESGFVEVERKRREAEAEEAKRGA